MAKITQLSPQFTSSYIEAILNQNVYSMTVDQVYELADMLTRLPITATSKTLLQVLGTTATTVTSASLAASTNSPTTRFNTGNAMSLTVNFSDNVTVTGTPEVHLVVGSNTRQATYASGTGTSALVFSYTVVSGDAAAAAAVTVATSALILNSGTMNDFTGTAVTLTLPSTITRLATATVNQ